MRTIALVLLVLACLPVFAAELPAREYKLLLRTEAFAGEPGAALRRLAGELELALAQEGVVLSGGYRKAKQRELVFFDTPGSCVLQRSGWILRQRQTIRAGEAKPGKPELTLKRRGPASGNRLAEKSLAKDVEFKAEEDVSPPEQVVLSYSWSRQTRRTLPDLAAAQRAFPVLQGLPLAEPLAVVGGLRIEERTYELLRLAFAAEVWPLAASVWRTPEKQILAVELSFRFAETDSGRREALRIFRLLQQRLPVQAAHAKTAMLYQTAGAFCD